MRSGVMRIAFVAAAVGLSAVLAVGAWKRAIRPHLFPKNFGVVEAGQIYRSGGLSPEALRWAIEEHGIRTVIDLGAYEDGSAADRREARTCEVLGAERVKFRLEGDSWGNPNNYVATLRLMSDPARQPVLVHCNAGAERTSCAVILYRHIVQGRAIEDVYHEAFEHRHSDERNPVLRRTLSEYTDEIGAAYRAGGQIPGHPEVIEPGPRARVEGP